jgi:hypothetical protein
MSTEETEDDIEMDPREASCFDLCWILQFPDRF